MNRKLIETFLHNLFFGTDERTAVTYIGIAIVISFTTPALLIYVMTVVFGMTATAALSILADGMLLLMVLYVLARAALVARRVWIETKNEIE